MRSIVLSLLLASFTLGSTPSTNVTLHDVTFANSSTGWVVGDGGAILTTLDGGLTWAPQRSPVRNQLRAVSFSDRHHGLAVGGFWRPLTGDTVGVVLRTTDGGQTWIHESGLLLPKLTDVVMHNAKQGIAVGYSSPLYPSGLMKTEDGGRSWKPLLTSDLSAWQAVAADQHRGLLVRNDGRLFQLADEQVKSLGSGNLIRHPMAVSLTNAGAIVIGKSGSAMLLGSSAKYLQLPTASRSANLQAIHSMDQNVWIAGNPGSIILRSKDDGQTWQSSLTNQAAEIRALHFVDQQQGVAVGESGTILLTRDGGVNWRAIRGSDNRVAVWCLVGSNDNVPIPLLASLAEQGLKYRVTTLGAQRDPIDAQDKLSQLAATLGGNVGDSLEFVAVPGSALELPVPRVIDRLPGEPLSALQKLTEQIVRRIRTLRPVVVAVSGESNCGVELLLKQLVEDAVVLAADANAFPQHMEIGLSPWSIKRTVEFSHDDENIAPTFRSIVREADYILARGSQSTSERPIRWKPLSTNASPALADVAIPYRTPKQLLRGLSSVDISGLTQNASKRQAEQQIAREIWSKQRNLSAILQRAPENLADGWSQQVAHLTRGMESEAASRVLFELATQLVARGNWTSAEDMFRLIPELHPNSSLVGAANRELVFLQTSEEVRLLKKRSTPAVKTLTAQLSPRDLAYNVRQVNYQKSATESEAQVRLADDPAAETDRFATGLRQTDPRTFNAPEVHLALAAGYRREHVEPASQSLLNAVTTRLDDPLWKIKARRELALQKGKHSRKPPWGISLVSTAPKLDGLLNELEWQRAKIHPLLPTRPGMRTEIRATYDERYLYLSAECSKAAAVDYAQTDDIRQRDADLAAFDRVEFHLDINRDYMSYWSFSVDHRGWTNESIGRFRDWNPKWFVAASANEKTWSVEIAIPLEAIGTANSDDVWMVGCRRITPGVGFQSSMATSSFRVDPRLFVEAKFE